MHQNSSPATPRRLWDPQCYREPIWRSPGLRQGLPHFFLSAKPSSVSDCCAAPCAGSEGWVSFLRGSVVARRLSQCHQQISSDTSYGGSHGFARGRRRRRAANALLWVKCVWRVGWCWKCLRTMVPLNFLEYFCRCVGGRRVIRRGGNIQD